MINEQDELLIQKCVDGELDVAMQQELLSSLDDVADGWKCLALAYVEEQAWSDSFVDADRAVAESERVAFDPMIQAPNMSQIHLDQEVMCFRQAEPKTARTSRAGSRLLTQATCLAIALVGGVLIGDTWRARSGGPPITSAKNSKTNPDSAGPGNSSEALSLVDLPGVGGGTTQFPVRRYTPMPVERELVPSRINSELRDLGFEVVEESRWYRFELDGGQQVLVPLHRKRIAPTGQ